MIRLAGGAAAVALMAAPALAGPATAIVHGRLLTVSHGVIEDGVLVMQDGRITAVGGPATRVPRGARIFDAHGMSVYPGLTDVEDSIGLREPNSVVRASASGAKDGEPAPATMIADVVHPTDYVDVERFNGVTQAIVSAGADGPLPGRSAVIQLADDKARMVIERDAGLVINFEGRRDVYPTTVFGVTGYVRQLFARARQLKEQGQAPGADEPEVAALMPFLDGGGLVIAHARNDTEVGDALDLAEEFRLKVVLCGLIDVDQSVGRIAAAKVPVVVGPLQDDPQPGRRFDAVYSLPARLAAAGVPVSISTMDGAPGGPRNLPYQAGLAASFGLTPEQALRAVTLAPAEVFGLGDRFGSLDVGKAANVAVAAGDPLDVQSDVVQVFIAGEAVPMTSRQTRLRDRYSNRR